MRVEIHKFYWLRTEDEQQQICKVNYEQAMGQSMGHGSRVKGRGS